MSTVGLNMVGWFELKKLQRNVQWLCTDVDGWSGSCVWDPCCFNPSIEKYKYYIYIIPNTKTHHLKNVQFNNQLVTPNSTSNCLLICKGPKLKDVVPIADPAFGLSSEALAVSKGQAMRRCSTSSLEMVPPNPRSSMELIWAPDEAEVNNDRELLQCCDLKWKRLGKLWAAMCWLKFTGMCACSANVAANLTYIKPTSCKPIDAKKMQKGVCTFQQKKLHDP